MSIEVKIVAVEEAGPTFKNGGGGFSVPLLLVLEDGRKIPSRRTFKRKKDAEARRPTLFGPVSAGKNYKALFSEKTGEFIGTQETFSIGAPPSAFA